MEEVEQRRLLSIPPGLECVAPGGGLAGPTLPQLILEWDNGQQLPYTLQRIGNTSLLDLIAPDGKAIHVRATASIAGTQTATGPDRRRAHRQPAAFNTTYSIVLDDGTAVSSESQPQAFEREARR